GLLLGALPAALLLRVQLLLCLSPALVLLALLRRGHLGLARGRLLALPLLRVELLLDARLLGPPLGGFLLLGFATLGVLDLALGGLLGLDLATLRVLPRGRFVALALLLRRLRLLPLLLGTSLFRFLLLATARTGVAACLLLLLGRRLAELELLGRLGCRGQRGRCRGFLLAPGCLFGLASRGVPCLRPRALLGGDPAAFRCLCLGCEARRLLGLDACAFCSLCLRCEARCLLG